MDTIDATKDENVKSVSKLTNLKLKRILTENHDLNINQICQNTCNEKYKHLFSTVGGNQVNIYDNKGMEDNLNLCFHFILEQSEYSMGGEILCCTWLNGDDDALLAIGTSKGEIHIISLRNTQVISILSHKIREEIVHISKCDIYNSLLVSQTANGNIYVWDFVKQSIIYELLNKDIITTSFATNDDIPSLFFFSHNENYKLLLPSSEFYINRDIEVLPYSLPFLKSSIFWTEYNSHYNKMILLTNSNILYIFDTQNQNDYISLTVPNTFNKKRNTIGFTLSQNQEYIFVGGNDKIYIINMQGVILFSISPTVMKKQDFISGFIDDNFEYMILCYGVSLFRYNYIDPTIKYVTRIKHAYPVEDLLLFFNSYEDTPRMVLQPKV